MGNFTFQKCDIEGLFLIDTKVYGDERGCFIETYHYDDFKKAGIPAVFVQDNQSSSRKGVLRGLHFQKTYPQGKLVSVLSGKVYDVAVDLRKNSPTYGRSYGVILSEENKKMIYIPEGFAHGFLVLSDMALFSYKCTDFYHPEDEGGILWNDPDINIEWPLEEGLKPVISEKDAGLPSLKQCGVAFDTVKA